MSSCHVFGLFGEEFQIDFDHIPTLSEVTDNFKTWYQSFLSEQLNIELSNEMLDHVAMTFDPSVMNGHTFRAIYCA